jgi:hypothetical protein
MQVDVAQQGRYYSPLRRSLLRVLHVPRLHYPGVQPFPDYSGAVKEVQKWLFFEGIGG